ncbi:unnamed protein product [Eruca vesicaria subsp. sativa]|uniref:Ethylene insensitive 3-like DNA-binding domain-containing protein n=1 Tax=Eruca vesicaria subsp. sativa TaxID=29727 RepID=A0ABC8KHN8_ERUVS|nr:unnamed protein product [Eruca vesicaria subsp. sativa]
MVEVEELEPLSPVEDAHEGEGGEEEEEEEEISYNDLKRRMWKDRNLMEKLKQQKRHNNNTDVVSLSTHRAEASRRKKMARSQDSVLKYMMKIMEVCKAKGFVYGIVPEKGKPITGSSDSLRRWWKENVQFDQNAPNAVSDYLTLAAAAAAELMEKEPSKALLNIKDLKISEDQEASVSKTKRKGEFMEPSKSVYTCQNSSCPQSDTSFGFVDKNSRTGHEIQCLYGSSSQSTGETSSVLETAPSIGTNTTSEDDYSASSSAMGKRDDDEHSNWMDNLWFERMQHEFNFSRRFEDDDDDTTVDLNQLMESNQSSDNVDQSTFSVWDMGCEDKDIYMSDH